MRMRRCGAFSIVSLALMIPLAALGCGDSSDTGSEATTSGSGGSSSASTSSDATTGAGGSGGGAAMMDVSLAFEAQVAGQVFSCATTYDGLGTAATSSEIADFRFYVHDVRLLAGGVETPVELEQDGVWQYENVALLDFEDKTGACKNGTGGMHTSIVGKIAEGTYDGIAFKVGLPNELNHADVSQAPSPLNLSGLFWNWQSGYKFMRIDSKPTDSSLPAFDLHLGATSCSGDPVLNETVTCSRPNVPEISLGSFDPSSSVVVFDYAVVVEASDLTQNGGGPPGCLSGSTDPECPEVFSRLGLDIATGDATSPQTAFHVE